jgi:penicillin-binding protein 2
VDYRERWELKDYLIGRTLERRIRLFHVVLLLMLLGFLLNFWYLQGVHGEDYARQAEDNRLRRIPLFPTRGVIFDRNREVLAASRPALSLTLRREQARDVEAQLRRLGPILDLPHAVLVERWNGDGRDTPYQPIVLEDDASLEELARIEARRELFPAIEVQETARRHYPWGPVFAHAIGYVGEVSEKRLTGEGSPEALRAGDIVGKSGVEHTYDEQVRGQRGWNVVSVNSLGRRIGAVRDGRAPEHGAPLETTLDRGLQQALIEGLGEEAGAGVFLDPWTGEVLALGSTPSFDPNRFADGISHEEWRAMSADPQRPLHDRAIASFYAPGSTFKVLMTIAALETGAVTPDETLHCSGSTRIYGSTRLCWKKGGHGTVNLRAALAHSCNVYFYQIGKRLGIEPIHDYGSRFGLGRRSGLDLPGEEEGVLPSADWKRRTHGEVWYPGDTISVAIGQGLLAVTPVQMARFIAAVATGGRLVRPHVLAGVEPQVEDLGIGAETVRIVRAALVDAVQLGTARRAGLKGIQVAGKTGTAQVYKHSAGVDSDKLPKEERDHAWFVGFAPADEPRIAFAVIVERGGHGGETAAPVARKVLEAFFAGPADERRPAQVAHARTEAARVGAQAVR